MKRFTLALAASFVMLAGCDGFREAMTAHVDTVARAGSQELTVERLGELMGTSKIPLTDDAAKAIANLWVNYQLLAQASAKNDSLNDPKAMDEAMWAMLSQQRASKWHEVIRAKWAVDTSATEASYMQGNVIAAAHILIGVPPQGLSQGKQDSLQRVAERLAQQATTANFAQLVEQYTMDPGSKTRAGIYVVPRGQFVPEFENAVLGLRPGEITKQPVRSQFGWHIIRRLTFAEVQQNHADEFRGMVSGSAMQAAESTYLAKLEESGNVKFRDDAAATIKAVMSAPEDYRTDKTVIATSKAGDFTGAKLARWIVAYPPRQQAMMRAQATQAPDSVLLDFTRTQFVRGELVLAQADSAKVELSPAELADARNQFSQLVHRLWAELKIQPTSLADSAKAEQQRARVAAEIVEQYMNELVQDKVPFVDVPMPVADVLRDKYDYKVNRAGITRALERASQVRTAMDSTRAGQQPPSQVPMMPQGMPQPQGQQVPVQPQQQPPAPQQ